MTVVIRTKSGAEHLLDRRYSICEIHKRVADGRQGRYGVMLALDDNRTPRRTLYVDPHEIESIRDNGHSY